LPRTSSARTPFSHDPTRAPDIEPRSAVCARRGLRALGIGQHPAPARSAGAQSSEPGQGHPWVPRRPTSGPAWSSGGAAPAAGPWEGLVAPGSGGPWSWAGITDRPLGERERPGEAAGTHAHKKPDPLPDGAWGLEPGRAEPRSWGPLSRGGVPCPAMATRRGPDSRRYRRARALLLSTRPHCTLRIVCHGALADSADHVPPRALHHHVEGSGCCRLQPACMACQRAQGRIVADLLRRRVRVRPTPEASRAW
jgi:hypothetical protein